MTTQIKLKKSSVSGNIPDSGDLQYGELAINFADGKLFYKNSSNEIKAFIDSAAVQSLITTYQGLDSAGVTNLVDSAYVQARQTDVGLDSAGVTNLVDSAYISARQSFDSASVTTLVDSAYVQARQIGAGFALYEYNATAGQSTFQDSDLSGDILSYDENNIMVHYNGILLSKTEYTATDGTSVVLDDPADSGSIIMIAKWLEGGQDTVATPSGGGSGSFTYGGDRAVYAGGEGSLGEVNTIDYFSISTLSGTASDFGDLTASYSRMRGCSDATYGLFAGAYVSTPSQAGLNVIDYITISTTGNAQDFGDLTVGRAAPGSCSDGTYGVWGGGYKYSSPSGYSNVIDYVTIASTGNAADFGDLNSAANITTACSDGTYGVWGGGFNGSGMNDIQYITIASTGNAQDFGDLTVARYFLCSVSDTTRGVFGSGTGATSTIDYVTIASTGNATDFGDMFESRSRSSGASDGTYGTFGGGAPPGAGLTSGVEYITIQTTGNGSDFGDLTAVKADPGSTSGNAS